MGATAATAYASLYGPTAAELAAGMSDVGEALVGQLACLEAAPDPDACERAARNLEGAARACIRLRAALLATERSEGGR